MRLRTASILATSLTFIAGLIVLFPARTAYQWFAPAELRVAGIEGTLWSGTAGEAWASGVYLRNLSWRMRPLELFRGKAAYAVAATPVTGFVEGNLAVGTDGTLTATDLRGSFSLQLLRQAFRNPGLDGSVSLQFAEIRVENCVPTRAAGSFQVSNLVNPGWHPYSLGGYRGDVSTTGDGIVVLFSSTDGSIRLGGELRLGEDGVAMFEPLLAITPATPANLRQFIQTLPKTEDGAWHYSPVPFAMPLPGC